MARKYFTLLEFSEEANAWYPQFGDYDCNVVKQEKRDMAYSANRMLKHYRIISSGSSGKAIAAAVEAFNVGWES